MTSQTDLGTAVAAGSDRAAKTGPERRARTRGQPVLERARRALPVIIIFIAFLVIWQLVVKVLNVSQFLLPAPTAVWDSLKTALSNNPFGQGQLGQASVKTFEASLLGFFIASFVGVAIASVMVWIPPLQRWFMPYVVGFQTLPRLAIAPLFIIWFGHGILAKVILASLLAFFPVLVNALAGLSNVDPLGVELLRSLKASRLQVFRYLQLPNALPYIFAGLEVALVFSLLGVIVAEFVGGEDGVGTLILQLHYNVDIAGVFAVLVVLVVVGLLLRALLLAVRNRMLFWLEDASQAGRE